MGGVTVTFSKEMLDMVGKILFVWVRRYIAPDMLYTYDKTTETFVVTVPTQRQATHVMILFEQVIQHGHPLRHFWI